MVSHMLGFNKVFDAIKSGWDLVIDIGYGFTPRSHGTESGSKLHHQCKMVVPVSWK